MQALQYKVRLGSSRDASVTKLSPFWLTVNATSFEAAEREALLAASEMFDSYHFKVLETHQQYCPMFNAGTTHGCLCRLQTRKARATW